MWSDDLPGLVLSHVDRDAVLTDLAFALKVFLGEFDKAEGLTSDAH